METCNTLPHLKVALHYTHLHREFAPHLRSPANIKKPSPLIGVTLILCSKSVCNWPRTVGGAARRTNKHTKTGPWIIVRTLPCWCRTDICPENIPKMIKHWGQLRPPTPTTPTPSKILVMGGLHPLLLMDTIPTTSFQLLVLIPLVPNEVLHSVWSLCPP